MGCCAEHVAEDFINSATISPTDFSCSVLHGSCGQLAADPSCNADVSATVRQLCVGKSHCIVNATAEALGVKDPCPAVNRTLKHLAVKTAGCAAGTPPTTSHDFQQHLAAFLVRLCMYACLERETSDLDPTRVAVRPPSSRVGTTRGLATAGLQPIRRSGIRNGTWTWASPLARWSKRAASSRASGARRLSRSTVRCTGPSSRPQRSESPQRPVTA